MLAVGEGASQEALERYRDMGVTNILLRSVKPAQTAQSSSVSSFTVLDYGLSYAEAERIRKTLPDATVVEVREIQKPIHHGEFFKSSIVVGTEPAFLDVTNMKVLEGRWLSDTDLTY